MAQTATVTKLRPLGDRVVVRPEARAEALRVRAPCEVNEADRRLRLSVDYSHYSRAKSIYSRGGGARGLKFLLE